jgi:DNA-binding transcriptional MerR regulator
MTNLDDLFNIREASEIAGVSEMTIRKYLGLTKPPRANRLPNARKQIRPGESVATWQIPLSDLHNAGLMKKGKSNQATAEAPGELQPDNNQVAQLKAEIEQLRITLAVLEQSNADLRANLADLRLLLGRSIETKEAQTLRQRLFRRNNQG